MNESNLTKKKLSSVAKIMRDGYPTLSPDEIHYDPINRTVSCEYWGMKIDLFKEIFPELFTKIFIEKEKTT